MIRSVLALWALAMPLLVPAQGFALRPPSIGESLQTMDKLQLRLGEHRPPRELEQIYILPERPGQNQVAWYDFGMRWTYWMSRVAWPTQITKTPVASGSSVRA